MDQRSYLIAVFQDTCRRIDESDSLSAALELSLSSQTLICENDPIPTPKAIYEQPANIFVSHNRSFEAAAQYDGQKVSVLNFASAANPGGGVTTGASAQEECLCRCSTLYHCLNTRYMWNRFYMPHRRSGNPLHNDDIIYTPDVQVIKDDDYRPLDMPFAVDVVTCAAPNLRERPAHAFRPGGSTPPRITPAELRALHERRARRILSVAAQHGAEVVVLGAFGCGAFRNDPMVVAQAYRNVLPDFLHCFRTIEFAIYCRPGDDSNYRAFRTLLG